MANERVRVLRILEYVGDREWVEETMRTSSVPMNGDSSKHTGTKNIIKSAIIDNFPEMLNNVDNNIDSDLIEVKDRVAIYNNQKRATHLGTVVSVNDFRPPEQKYAVDVDGYDDDVLFFGEEDLKVIK
jgi:hypothetical protein